MKYPRVRDTSAGDTASSVSQPRRTIAAGLRVAVATGPIRCRQRAIVHFDVVRRTPLRPAISTDDVIRRVGRPDMNIEFVARRGQRPTMANPTSSIGVVKMSSRLG